MKEREKYDNINFTGGFTVKGTKGVFIPGSHLYKVEKEALDMYKKVYGEYHPRVTEAMFIMATNMFCMFKNGFKRENLIQFTADTFKHLKISHGADHEICKMFLQMWVDASIGAVPLPLPEEIVMK